MKNFVFVLLFLIFCIFILVLGIRGRYGNPTGEELNESQWKDNGPLELSPDRGRFALTYSIIEDKSVYFSLPIAKFATPDLGYENGKYVSLFAPGVSFIVSPGYILGKALGISQVGSFAVISLFAIFNVLLSRSIAIKLGADNLAATIGSTIFIFATPAFAYAVTLYQHHISTFLILASIYILLRWTNLWSLTLIWFLCATSVVVDYPNLFLMLPIGLFALGKIIFIKSKEDKLIFNIKPLGFLTFITVVIPIAFFLWFNKASYGNPMQIAGTVASVKAIDSEGKPAAPARFGQDNIDRFLNPESQRKTAVGFFESRDLLTLLNAHILSPDRGTLTFAPVTFFGIFGVVVLFRRKNPMLNILIGIVGLDVLLYSMFGYGGWSFGSRYMIPAYSIMAIFIGIALTFWRKNTLLLIIFLLVAIYSIAVNALGAVTSNRNPPRVEAIPLGQITGREEKYTFERNLDFLLSNKSKSFVYQAYASKFVNATQYYLIITIPIIVLLTSMVLFLRFFSRETNDKK